LSELSFRQQLIAGSREHAARSFRLLAVSS
jgi:hypothetical protein